MATTADLKNGITLEIESQLWTVVEFQHVKPGKGPAFVRTKLKSVLTGKVIDRTFNSGVKIDIAILEKRDLLLTEHSAGSITSKALRIPTPDCSNNWFITDSNFLPLTLGSTS